MVNYILKELKSRELTAGGFPEQPGGGFRPDSSAWVGFALARLATERDLVDRICSRLAQDQQTDGRISVDLEFPSAWWPTPIAVLAWHAVDSFQESSGRATQFLLATSGEHFEKKANAPISHDPALIGWSWIEDTHSWVEPTALALLALEVTGFGHHERSNEARRMLMDRQLPSGGWNYGNKKVFGQELRPLPETTGMALQSLAGHVSRESIGPSLDYIGNALNGISTPLSLGWSVLGLSAWDQRPTNTEERIKKCLGCQEITGPYSTSGLSLLLIVLTAHKGLNS